MSAFTGFQGIFPVPNGKGGVWGWVTVGELRWEVGVKGSGLWVIVPDGFTTDLASIPRWLHGLLNPYDPQTVKAAVLHDWLTPDKVDRETPGYDPIQRPLWQPRTTAGEFYEALKADGMAQWKRGLYYAAVVASVAEY